MSWKVKSFEDNHIQCSLCKPPTVYLEPVPRNKIELLLELYPHQEWFAYLSGNKTKENNYVVDNISVPPHRYANGGNAEAEQPDYDATLGKYKFHQPKNCLGVIHSHHSMGAFHSGIDHDYVDKNYPISITVAKIGNSISYDTACFLITPCGKATVGKCELKYISPRPLFDAKRFLEDAQNNIEKGRKVTEPAPFQQELSICGQDSYIPIRYRISRPGKNGDKGEDTAFFSDDKGNPLSQKDIEQIFHNANRRM